MSLCPIPRLDLLIIPVSNRPLCLNPIVKFTGFEFDEKLSCSKNSLHKVRESNDTLTGELKLSDSLGPK